MLSRDGEEHCAHLTGEKLKAKKHWVRNVNSVVMSSEEIIDWFSKLRMYYGISFFINPAYNAEKTCPLAVVEQNFSEYFAKCSFQ